MKTHFQKLKLLIMLCIVLAGCVTPKSYFFIKDEKKGRIEKRIEYYKQPTTSRWKLKLAILLLAILYVCPSAIIVLLQRSRKVLRWALFETVKGIEKAKNDTLKQSLRESQSESTKRIIREMKGVIK